MTAICNFISGKIEAFIDSVVFFNKETFDVMNNFPRHETSTVNEDYSRYCYHTVIKLSMKLTHIYFPSNIAQLFLKKNALKIFHYSEVNLFVSYDFKTRIFFFNFVSNQVVSLTQQEWMHIAAEGLKMKIIKTANTTMLCRKSI